MRKFSSIKFQTNVWPHGHVVREFVNLRVFECFSASDLLCFDAFCGYHDALDGENLG